MNGSRLQQIYSGLCFEEHGSLAISSLQTFAAVAVQLPSPFVVIVRALAEPIKAKFARALNAITLPVRPRKRRRETCFDSNIFSTFSIKHTTFFLICFLSKILFSELFTKSAIIHPALILTVSQIAYLLQPWQFLRQICWHRVLWYK